LQIDRHDVLNHPPSGSESKTYRTQPCSQREAAPSDASRAHENSRSDSLKYVLNLAEITRRPKEAPSA